MVVMRDHDGANARRTHGLQAAPRLGGRGVDGDADESSCGVKAPLLEPPLKTLAGHVPALEQVAMSG